MPKPYYEHAGITIYHGDCLEPPELDRMVDAVLSYKPPARPKRKKRKKAKK